MDLVWNLFIMTMLPTKCFRLKLNYIVKDETGTAAVTFWDSQAKLLVNKTAVEMINELPEVLIDVHLLLEWVGLISNPILWCLTLQNVFLTYCRIKKMAGQWIWVSRLEKCYCLGLSSLPTTKSLTTPVSMLISSLHVWTSSMTSILQLHRLYNVFIYPYKWWL